MAQPKVVASCWLRCLARERRAPLVARRGLHRVRDPIGAVPTRYERALRLSQRGLVLRLHREDVVPICGHRTRVLHSEHHIVGVAQGVLADVVRPGERDLGQVAAAGGTCTDVDDLAVVLWSIDELAGSDVVVRRVQDAALRSFLGVGDADEASSPLGILQRGAQRRTEVVIARQDADLLS